MHCSRLYLTIQPSTCMGPMIIINAILLAVGHVSAAFLFYTTHRWILHPRSARQPLRSAALQHRTHHAQPGDPGHFFFSWWVNVAIWGFTALVAACSPALAMGMVTYYGAYAYYHRSSHYRGQSRAARHHQGHHYVNPRSNFAVVYPAIDRLFGTRVVNIPEELDARMDKVKKAR